MEDGEWRMAKREHRLLPLGGGEAAKKTERMGHGNAQKARKWSSAYRLVPPSAAFFRLLPLGGKNISFTDEGDQPFSKKL
jgi:hypothetical protein